MNRYFYIIFVPKDGVQVEIVGKNDRLLTEEAFTKIVRVLNDQDEQTSLCNYLNSTRELLLREKSMESIGETVRRFQTI